MDHFSFQVGSDMKYTQDVLQLMEAFNSMAPEDAIKKSLYWELIGTMKSYPIILLKKF